MLRHTITLPIGGDEVALDVDFRVLATIERVYDLRAEYVAGLLELDHKIRRSQVAEIVLQWLVDQTDYLKSRRRLDVLEEIATAPDAMFRRYVGAIQGAILFSLRQISPEDLAKLARGEDLAPKKDESASKKKPETPSP